MRGGFESSGLAGMAFKGIQEYNTPTLIESMYNSKLIDKMV